MVELIPAEPQHIADMIDNEGWPDALGWLVTNDFGDEELNQLIYDANDVYSILENFYREIKHRANTLGVDWYV